MASLRRLLARLAGVAPASGDDLAAQLARRNAEGRALEDLTRLLSASLEVERVATGVTGFACRLLDAEGSAVLLAADDQQGFVTAAAAGSLAHCAGRRLESATGGIVLDAVAHEQLRVASGDSPDGVMVCDGVRARSAAAAPLLAHGVTAGALVVVDKRGGPFDEDDGRLLAAVATHTAVALANARFFEMVERGKRQWEATFDALSEGIALVDARGRVLRANAGFARLTGERLQALIGRHACDVLFGEPRSLADLLDAAREGMRTPPLVRRSDLLRRVLRVVAAPIAATAGMGSVVVAVEDVTEQQALEAQAIQSEKMAAVGTLVSGVAHELNNPLTSIAGLAEFLLEQPEGTVPDRDHLRVIAEEAQRAGSIVRNLLTFARKGPAERARLDLGDVIERTLFLMDWELKLQGITLERHVAPDLPAVVGDRQQLQQVVLNLVTNAAQAVAALPAGLPRRVTVSAEAVDERVVVRVADSGLGIPADVLPQVFSPFFTTKSQGEGTGLGLFISYGLVEGHGGTLTAESRPGAGATFTLALPGAGGRAGPAPGMEERGAPAPAFSPRRILLVDDDPGVRRLVAALFTHEGHKVDAAPDGDAALRLAREGDYDLVIADRRAAAAGAPFLQALERARPGWGPRVIVSTADVQAGPAAGGPTPAARTLRKPLNLRDLREAAAAVWAATAGQA
ncbi:MAG: ATP-binding protein [Gemmatimonadales bacterium]